MKNINTVYIGLKNTIKDFQFGISYLKFKLPTPKASGSSSKLH